MDALDLNIPLKVVQLSSLSGIAVNWGILKDSVQIVTLEVIFLILFKYSS